mmetsp:Transcript_178163/g.571082  ORF Transcript_178163/g.571082 Transcript_178163/m.571082 type:complete len:292 (-) Transcript_178163:359-1234(-)
MHSRPRPCCSAAAAEAAVEGLAKMNSCMSNAATPSLLAETVLRWRLLITLLADIGDGSTGRTVAGLPRSRAVFDPGVISEELSKQVARPRFRPATVQAVVAFCGASPVSIVVAILPPPPTAIEGRCSRSTSTTAGATQPVDKRRSQSPEAMRQRSEDMFTSVWRERATSALDDGEHRPGPMPTAFLTKARSETVFATYTVGGPPRRKGARIATSASATRQTSNVQWTPPVRPKPVASASETRLVALLGPSRELSGHCQTSSHGTFRQAAAQSAERSARPKVASSSSSFRLA